MHYLSVKQTAECRGISTRRIQILCGQGRILGAVRIGNVWAVPSDAEKPKDAGIKSGQYVKISIDHPITNAKKQKRG